MKKLLLVLAIGAFAACNNASQETTPADTTAVAAPADTTAAPAVDTTAPAADTTTAK